MAFDITTAKPIKRGFDISTAKPVSQEEPMSLSGLGKNALGEIGAMGEMAKNVVLAIPRAGYNIGKDIGRIYKENKSVAIPYGGIKAVAREAIEPWTKRPIQSTLQVIKPVTDVAKSIVVDMPKAYLTHPIKTAYEQPIGTAALLAPIVPKVSKMTGITKAGRLAKGKALASEATAEFRSILRPEKGEIKNIEIRGRKDINDYYKLAAEENLPIKQTAEKKLDTKSARIQLEGKMDELNNVLDQELSKSNAKFDLLETRKRAIESINKKETSALEKKDAIAEVDEIIGAEINARGNIISAKDLNTVKRGMWKFGYKAMKPTAKSTARMIGHVAKEQLEAAIPNKLKAINEMTGKYATLTDLLRNAQGRVIKGGRLGQYFARSTGAVVGGMVGSAIPIPGVGSATGALTGQWAGGKIMEAISNPERAALRASSKMNKARNLLKTPTFRIKWSDKLK